MRMRINISQQYFSAKPEPKVQNLISPPKKVIHFTPNVFSKRRDGNPEDGATARRVEEVVLVGVGEHGVVHRVHEVGRLLLELEGGLKRTLERLQSVSDTDCVNCDNTYNIHVCVCQKVEG